MPLAKVLPLVLVVACGAPDVRRASPPTAPRGAAPATPVASPSTTPCFPGPPLAALDVYHRLEKYAWSLYASAEDEERVPPATTFGSCTVDRNVVRAADGTVVAELGCGVRVLSRGILDDLGLQLGAHGQDVLDRKPKPVPPLVCTANGPSQVRCHFERPEDSDTDASWYVLAGSLGDADVLEGERAVRWFSTATVVEIEVSVWCH